MGGNVVNVALAINLLFTSVKESVNPRFLSSTFVVIILGLNLSQATGDFYMKHFENISTCQHNRFLFYTQFTYAKSINSDLIYCLK